MLDMFRISKFSFGQVLFCPNMIVNNVLWILSCIAINHISNENFEYSYAYSDSALQISLDKNNRYHETNLRSRKTGGFGLEVVNIFLWALKRTVRLQILAEI